MYKHIFLHRPIGVGGGESYLHMVHSNERLTVDGKLSVHKIVDGHPLLKDVFVIGMEWFVWKAPAEVLFPSLPDIAQRALNAKYSIQQGQDVFQVHLRAMDAWLSGMGKDKNDPGNFIMKDILKANPKCAPIDVKSCVEVARKFGGGDNSIVEQLRVFLGAYKKADRTVSSAALDAMATLKLAPSEMCPNFIASIFMTLASAPKDNMITGSEIKTIGQNKNIPDATRTEEITKSIIVIANRMGVAQHIATKELGEFRSATVLKFFKKAKPLKQVSVESMASQCYTALSKHATTKVENPWATHKVEPIKLEIAAIPERLSTSNPKCPPAVDKPALQAVVYADGKVVGAHAAMIANHGFTLNAMVMHKKERTITHELI